jgi:hypothetical protein
MKPSSAQEFQQQRTGINLCRRMLRLRENPDQAQGYKDSSNGQQVELLREH